MTGNGDITSSSSEGDLRHELRAVSIGERNTYLEFEVVEREQ